jgi:tungstate transport system ATP-binding protein
VPPILSLKNIEKRYNDHIALQVEELAFEPHRIYSLVGPNGCGKSTLLQILALLLKPTHGELFFNGQPVAWNNRDLQRLRKQITLVHQSPYLFDSTVKQNLAYGLKLRGIRGDEQHRRIHETLDLVGLSGFARRRARELSGGEQQRVALARALLLEPRILLLDEPTSNMDKASIDAFDNLLPTLLDQDLTIVQATHSPDQPKRLGSEVLPMAFGRLV